MAGLPQAMVVKRELLRAQHASEVPTPAPGTVEQPREVVIPHMDGPPVKPVQVVPPTTPVEEPPALTLEQQWKAEAQKNEQRWKSLQGVIESLEPTLKREKTERERLELELKQLREALPPPPIVPDPDTDLTEDELKIYGDSQAVITKIARKIARGETASAMADIKQELKELREASNRVQTDLTTTSEEQFMSHVKARIPNFDKIVQLEDWKQYIGTTAPYSRETIYDLLSKAHKSRDIDKIVEIFGGFKPSREALAAMVTPSLGGGGNVPLDLNGIKKPMLKWSDRKKVSEDFRMGRIPKEERDKWDKLFKEAEAENRIDFNA